MDRKNSGKIVLKMNFYSFQHGNSIYFDFPLQSIIDCLQFLIELTKIHIFVFYKYKLFTLKNYVVYVYLSSNFRKCK